VSSAPPLEIHDLTVTYEKAPVLYGVDATITAGKLVGVMGPNGAGKSTLIKAIMGMLRPTGGWVKIFGSTEASALRRVGYVPQRESVDWDFPVTVRDVVTMGCYGRLGLFKRVNAEEKARVRRCLDRVGMLPFANRHISELSGGQQQRVFLARALAQESDLYLLDEPFAGVDAATEAAVVEILRELRDEGRAILVVHHDLPTAREYFDELMLLNMRLVAFGPVEDVFRPEHLHEAYGGRLTILSEVTHRVARRED